MCGVASGVLGVPRGLVKLISGTNRAVIKFVTVKQSRNTMNMTMKVRGALEADVPKPLEPQYLEVVPREQSKVSIDGGDLSTSFLKVRAVGLKRSSRTVMDQAGGGGVAERIIVESISRRGEERTTVEQATV